MSSGITDSSLIYHLQNAKRTWCNTKGNRSDYYSCGILYGLAKGLGSFNLAKEVWQPKEGDLPYEDEGMRAHAKSMVFPIESQMMHLQNILLDKATLHR